MLDVLSLAKAGKDQFIGNKAMCELVSGIMALLAIGLILDLRSQRNNLRVLVEGLRKDVEELNHRNSVQAETIQELLRK